MLMRLFLLQLDATIAPWHNNERGQLLGAQELTGVLREHCELVQLLSDQLVANRAEAGGPPPASIVGLAARYRRAVGAAFASAAPSPLTGAILGFRDKGLCIQVHGLHDVDALLGETSLY